MAKTTARVTLVRTKTFTYTIDLPGYSALTDAEVLAALNLPGGANSVGELLAGAPANNGAITVASDWAISTNTDIEPYTLWRASRVYAVGDRVVSPTPAARVFVVRAVTGNATGGATEPAWSTTIGTDNIDGNATLVTVDKFGAANTGGVGSVRTFAVSSAYTRGQIVKPTAGSTQEYLVTTAGTSAATAPTWSAANAALGVTVTSGTAVFTLIAQ